MKRAPTPHSKLVSEPDDDFPEEDQSLRRDSASSELEALRDDQATAPRIDLAEAMRQKRQAVIGQYIQNLPKIYEARDKKYDEYKKKRAEMRDYEDEDGNIRPYQTTTTSAMKEFGENIVYVAERDTEYDDEFSAFMSFLKKKVSSKRAKEKKAEKAQPTTNKPFTVPQVDKQSVQPPKTPDLLRRESDLEKEYKDMADLIKGSDEPPAEAYKDPKVRAYVRALEDMVDNDLRDILNKLNPKKDKPLKFAMTADSSV